MAQTSWFYTFPFGKKYEIGLYHSPDGHVVLYCEGEIMKIEFNVLQTTTYSFYIENVLISVILEKQNDGAFLYFLKDDTIHYEPAQNNPANEKILKYLLYIIVILFVVLLMWIFSFHRN